MLRSLAILTALICVSVPFLPMASATNPCTDAMVALTNALSEDHWQFTLRAGPYLAAAVQACAPSHGPLPDPDNLPDPTALVPPLMVAAERAASDCMAGVPDVSGTAPITVSYQVVSAGIDRTESDQGVATATYSKNTDLTSYTVRGTTYGFDSWDQGSPTSPPLPVPGWGIVYVAGVPIPAIYPEGMGKAFAGCTDATIGSLCWGRGDAYVWIPNQFVMHIWSSFDKC